VLYRTLHAGKVFITPIPLLKLGGLFGVGRLRELVEAYDTLERLGDVIVKDRRAMHADTVAAGKEVEQVGCSRFLAATSSTTFHPTP